MKKDSGEHSPKGGAGGGGGGEVIDMGGGGAGMEGTEVGSTTVATAEGVNGTVVEAAAEPTIVPSPKSTTTTATTNTATTTTATENGISAAAPATATATTAAPTAPASGTTTAIATTVPSTTTTTSSNRGRRDRPCDACRRRKSRCVMNDGAEICVLCQFHSQDCTFVQSPQPRKRRLASSAAANAGDEQVVKKRYVQEKYMYARGDGESKTGV